MLAQAQKVSLSQVTGLNTALNSKLSLSTADTRYNKVSDNLNPWQYLYRKTQTDSLFLKLDPNHADPNQSIYGNLTMTDGNLMLNNGEFYSSLGVSTGGKVRTFSEFRAGSNTATITINDGATSALSLVQSTIGTDSKAAIFGLFGNGTERSMVLTTNNSRLQFDRYVIAATQTQVTNTYPDGNLVTPITGSFWELTNGTTHLAYAKTDNSFNIAGALTATTINGNTFTAGSSTFTGTASAVYTFPTASKTIAANDGSNWTFTSQAIGDLHYATSTSAYGRLADVAVGSVLVSGGVGVAPAWSASIPSATTATTQAVSINNTTIATTAFVRLYTQPINATATALTPGASVTWTPALGTNRYTLVPAQAEVINMGTIPSSLVGTEMTLVITTSGTTSFGVTAGTNLKMQGALNTGTVTAMTFVLKFLVLTTTSVVEVSRTIAM